MLAARAVFRLGCLTYNVFLVVILSRIKYVSDVEKQDLEYPIIQTRLSVHRKGLVLFYRRGRRRISILRHTFFLKTVWLRLRWYGGCWGRRRWCRFVFFLCHGVDVLNESFKYLFEFIVSFFIMDFGVVLIVSFTIEWILDSEFLISKKEFLTVSALIEL